MLQSNLTAPSQTSEDGGIGNDDSMIVHTHDDNGDDNNNLRNEAVVDVSGEYEEDDGEGDEDEEEDEDCESCYGPWQCLSDREIGNVAPYTCYLLPIVCGPIIVFPANLCTYTDTLSILL